MFDDVIEKQLEYYHGRTLWKKPRLSHKVLDKIASRPGNYFVVDIKENGDVVYDNQSPKGFHKRFEQWSKLIETTVKQESVAPTRFIVWADDHVPDLPVFGFCKRKDCRNFMIPSMRFPQDDVLDTDGWESTKLLLATQRQQIKFPEKQSKFYMDGIVHTAKTLYYDFAAANRDIAAASIPYTSVHGWAHANETQIAAYIDAGFDKENQVPFAENSNYKYIVYTDGNSLSDRMRLLMGTGSCIVKADEQLYEEFYSSLLKENVNYVRVKPDFSNGREVFDYLQSNQGFCQEMIANNIEFIENVLTYDNVVGYTAQVLNAYTDVLNSH